MSLEDVPVVLPVVEPVLEVEDGLLLCVAVALSLDFLCFMSPIASAEPLASAMMEVRTNAGASLRIMPPMVARDWWCVASEKLAASVMPRIDALDRGPTGWCVNFLRREPKKNAGAWHRHCSSREQGP